MRDPLLGTVIDERYELVDVVGRGGMGVVYRASDAKLGGRPCAVKLLSGASMDPEEAARFERELRIISMLRSSHVVQVLDTGVLPDNRRFIVMELLEGLPLSTLLKRGGPLTPNRAIRIAKGILAGLSEAHEAGVVHRDLKPANVFISLARTGEETAKVLDFGIAKQTGAATQQDLTAASMLIGTPKYMAPEQFLKQGTDARTDLYAVGLLFYQMLCGQPPFAPESPVPDTVATMPEEFRVGWLHINQLPAPLDLPPGLWEVVARLLAKSPDERFSDAASVIQALMAIGHGTGAPPPVRVENGEVVHQDNSQTTGFPVLGETLNAPAPQGGGRGGLVAFGLLALALAGGGAWYLLQPPEAAEERAAASEPMCTDLIQSEPTGATVMVGAKSYGATPARVERPCREAWLAKVQLEGYPSEKVRLRGQGSMQRVELRKSRAPAAAPRRAAPAEKPAPSMKAAPEKRATKKRRPPKKSSARKAPKKRRPPAVKKPAPKPAEDEQKGDSPLFF